MDFGEETTHGLISEQYREINALLHRQRKSYGTSGVNYRDSVIELCRRVCTRDVLDYGCGKGLLAKTLPFPIREYDPAIVDKREIPKSADIVVCTDVLEHIEPDYLGIVIRHIWRLTHHVAFFAIGLGAAKKNLPDGRNAHLIQRTPTEWTMIVTRYCKSEDILIHEAGIVRKDAMEMTLWKNQSASS